MALHCAMPVEGQADLDVVLGREPNGYVTIGLKRGEMSSQPVWPIGEMLREWLIMVAGGRDGSSAKLEPAGKHVGASWIEANGAICTLHVIDHHAAPWKFKLRRADLTLALQALSYLAAS